MSHSLQLDMGILIESPYVLVMYMRKAISHE